MALYDLIRNIVPNFADKQLRAMVPWFKLISESVDSLQTNFKAAGQVTAGATFASGGDARYGFIAAIAHPSNGLYNLTLSTPISNDLTVDTINNYILQATLANLATSDTLVYDIGAQFVDVSTIRVRIYSVEDGAETLPADHDFYISCVRMPGGPATA